MSAKTEEEIEKNLDVLYVPMTDFRHEQIQALWRYIQRLEAENAALKEQIAALQQ